jgi:hypothetical protein
MYTTVRSPYVASSPLLHPGLAQEDIERTKEMTKEIIKGITKESRPKISHSSAAEAMKEGVGRKSGRSSSSSVPSP